MKTETKYKEIFKLKQMLDKENIKYEFYDDSIGDFKHYQICCPDNTKDRYISVIEGYRYIRQ